MKPFKELINTEDPGWVHVQKWIHEANKQVEVLAKDPQRADSALFHTQVTTWSSLGAVIYESGGILVDHAWLRILGSGSEKINRCLPDWNKGKAFDKFGQAWAFTLIADDAIGGFFALNGGAFGEEGLGKVFYLSPDQMEWEPLGVGYSAFLRWAFAGDLKDFYGDLRWENWQEEIENMGSDKGMNFYPPLWMKFEDIEKLNRKPIPIAEMWSLQMATRTELLNKNK